MSFFEKYKDALTSHPNGRPVGVRNGMGQQPVTAGNPTLSGLAQAVNGAQGMLSTAKPPIQKSVPTNKPNVSSVQKTDIYDKRESAYDAWSKLL